MPEKLSPQGKLRIVFMGTPAFALSSFLALAPSEEIIAVVTQPDRPKGRKGILAAPPIKTVAISKDIPIFQPERLRKSKETIEILRGLDPDLIVVVAYGQILPEAVLQIPRLGCINVHASLLPKYRGAAPIQWAIIHGALETGVTTMKMDAGMDTGPILLKRSLKIAADETSETLSPKLADLGASLLLETLSELKKGRLIPVPQESRLATLAPLLKKEDSWVRWESKTLEIYNRWRGLFPWPGTTTFYKNSRWKITEMAVGGQNIRVGKPGELLRLSEKGLEVATRDGYILIKRLQPPGKREMTPTEYAAGHPLELGTVLHTEEI